MRLKRQALLSLVLLLSATPSLVGCAASNPPAVNHPGSFNTFDSTTYDSLLVTHSVIESTKADLAANKFTAAIAPKVKTALNNLISAYDVADTIYISYHSALATGTATVAQQTAVSNAIVNVNAATTSLSTAKAGN